MKNSVRELVGKTPLMRLKGLEQVQKLKGRLYAKCEFFNPTGSVKDRIALAMIVDAEERGILKPGGTIIEPTSGNTGIGLAAIGATLGYRVIIVMPESMSIERRKMMSIYGAELVLTPAAEGMTGAIAKAEELYRHMENSLLAGQFVNPVNWQTHYKCTGPEIWNDIGNEFDTFVAGVGTGGTITGCARYFKEKSDNMHVIAIEPEKSPVLSGGVAGAHGLQGIGAGFIPDVLDMTLVDEILKIHEEEAADMVRLLAKTEGLFCGLSSGAALAGAVKWMAENQGHDLVVVLPDSGNRYLSSSFIFNS